MAKSSINRWSRFESLGTPALDTKHSTAHEIWHEWNLGLFLLFLRHLVQYHVLDHHHLWKLFRYFVSWWCFSSPAINPITTFTDKQLITQDLHRDITIKFSSFIFKVCSMDQQNQYNLETLRSAESQASWQTYGTRITILAWYSGDCYAHII